MDRIEDVLLVEDNPGDVLLVSRHLRDRFGAFCRVRNAPTLAAAGDALRKQRPALVLLDLSLPDSHGLETVVWMQAHAPHVPLIVLTGYDDDDVAIEALSLGADDWLCKQHIDGPALVNAMYKALHRRQGPGPDSQPMALAEHDTARLQAELDEQRLLSKTMAHDLRVPLNGIAGYATLLRMGTVGKLAAEQEAQLSGIEASAREMSEFISGLLRMSGSAVQPLKRADLDLSGLASDIARKLALDDSCQPMAWRIQEKLMARGDPALIRSVLENLLHNAWKFSAQAVCPLIEFMAYRDASGRRVFVVRDRGVGFSQAEAQQLFEPYQRLSSSADYHGHGLGLASVKRILDRHGGDIWAESVPHVQTSFHFTLPD